MKAPCIVKVVVKSLMVLEISWSTGEVLTADVTEQASRFAILASLAEPAVFSGAHVGLWGHSVVWSDDADMGADLLYDLCRSQAGLPTPTEFDQWIIRNGLSLTKAAETLGLSRRMVAHYRSGSKPIPKIVGFACKGWEVEHKKAA